MKKGKKKAAIAVAAMLSASTAMNGYTIHAQTEEEATSTSESTPSQATSSTAKTSKNVFTLGDRNKKAATKDGSVALNATNFPDDTFRGYLSATYDSNQDGFLSPAEIQNITIIDVSSDVFDDSQSIESLQGLSFFTNLETLNCYGTNISQLDVSKNPNLTTLACYDDQLTSLDVSHNPKLFTLNCGNNPQITSLDVSHNPQLDSLDCSRTAITTLNINNNLLLRSLETSYTNITTLDVSNNLLLQNLGVSNTGVSAIDVHKNSALITLNCSNTSITSVDVTKNSELQSLTVSSTNIDDLNVHNNKDLQSLELFYTQVPHIDVSNNPDLTTLNCSNTPIASLDVSHNPKLDTLSCNNTYITTLDLSKNPNLIYLDCSSTNLQGLDVRHNPLLQSVDCSTNLLAWLEIGTNPNMTELIKSDSELPLRIKGSSFNIKDKYPGIDPQKMTIVSGGHLDKDTGIITDYKPNVPVVYTYACGTSANGPETLHVSLDITIIKQDSTIKIHKNLNKTYNGKPVSLSENDITVTGTPNKATYAWKDKEGRLVQSKMDLAPVDAGSYVVVAHADGNDFYNPADTLESFTIAKADNHWTLDPHISNWTYGDIASQPSAKAIYGEPIFTYSDKKDGVYSSSVPTDAGVYYMKAAVPSSRNYNALETIVPFTILPKDVNKSNDIVLPKLIKDSDLENFVITDGDHVLKPGEDYDFDKSQTGNMITLTATFTGNYTGTLQTMYTIHPVNPSNPIAPTDPIEPNSLSIATPRTPTNKSTTKQVRSVASKPANKTVVTGDMNRMGMLISVGAISLGCIAIILHNRKK